VKGNRYERYCRTLLIAITDAVRRQLGWLAVPPDIGPMDCRGQGRSHRYDLFREPWRSFSGGAISQFRSDEDAGTDLLFANLSCMFRCATPWIADEIGNNVGASK
jgi:hypothetical protein